DVAGADRDVLVLREMRRHVDGAVANDADLVDAAGAAALGAGRPGPAVVHHHRHARLAATQPDPVVDAEAAAELAGAARAFVQRILLEQHRVELLHDLDRRRLRDADRRAAVADAVAVRAAAVTAARDHVHHVGAVLLGIEAADAEVAAGAGRRAEQAIGNRL